MYCRYCNKCFLTSQNYKAPCLNILEVFSKYRELTLKDPKFAPATVCFNSEFLPELIFSLQLPSSHFHLPTLPLIPSTFIIPPCL